MTDRLRHCVRREDSIARLGGDEFTVLLEDMRDPSDAARLAERIGESLRIPFDIVGQQVNISSSVGIALDTDRSHRPDDLLREADMAMYRAKSGGKSRYEIFDTSMGTRAMERLELEADLRHAPARGELALWYVPVVELASSKMASVEAHLRWRHPRRGLLAASEFLPVAEETGSVVELGEWALREAGRQALEWPDLTVQLNVSARQLEQPGFIELVSEVLDDTGLPARRLLLLMSENAIGATAILHELRALGVRLGLSDVGDGPSSLQSISQLPFEVLKLARPQPTWPRLASFAPPWRWPLLWACR